jgi:hypothetical protein
MTMPAPGGAPRRRTARRVSIAGALIGAAALLAGCQTTAGDLAAAGYHEWQPIPPGAIAARSTAGTFPGVEGRERRTPNEVYQHMVLVNETTVPGQNELVVMADTASFFANRQGVPRIGQYQFRADDVSAMIAEAFAGASEIRDPQLRRNSYGPFYYVEAFFTGRANCVLAWQVLDNRDGGYPVRANRVTTRYRMCDPSKSTAELLADFEGLTLAL